MGFPAPVVTWRKLTGVLPRSRAVRDKGSLALIDAEKSDTGPYECTATNRLGETSAVTTVVVWSPPKFITRSPGNLVKFIGQKLTLGCLATEQASISWRRIDGAWESARMNVQNGTLTIAALKKSDSGNYTCEAKLLFYSIEATTALEVTSK